MLNTRDLGSRFLQPHDAEGIGPAAGGTFTFLDQAWMQVSYIQEVLPIVKALLRLYCSMKGQRVEVPSLL